MGVAVDERPRSDVIGVFEGAAVAHQVKQGGACIKGGLGLKGHPALGRM